MARRPVYDGIRAVLDVEPEWDLLGYEGCLFVSARPEEPAWLCGHLHDGPAEADDCAAAALTALRRTWRPQAKAA